MSEAVREQAETGHPSVIVRPLDQPGDLGWVTMAHGEIYTAEQQWDHSFEALVARIVADWAADHDPAWEAAWIAEVHGRRVGCVFCVTGDDAETAKLRILLVDPRARGLGLGARLVDTCVAFARSAGYRRVTLWTVDRLTSARRIYRSAGFELVQQEPEHVFGHDLISQTWTLDLHPLP